LIAYFIGNISAKKYQNLFMCVRVIASHRWDVFLRHGVIISGSAPNLAKSLFIYLAASV